MNTDKGSFIDKLHSIFNPKEDKEKVFVIDYKQDCLKIRLESELNGLILPVLDLIEGNEGNNDLRLKALIQALNALLKLPIQDCKKDIQIGDINFSVVYSGGVLVNIELN